MTPKERRDNSQPSHGFDKSIAFVKRLTARSFIHSLLCVVDSHLKIKPSNKKGFVVKSHSHK